MTLKINTEKGLFKPITIEINGKLFTAKRITRDVLKKWGENFKAAIAGDFEAGYKQVELLFGKSKELDNLEAREIKAINDYIFEQIVTSKPEKEDEEKKVTGPGDKVSP